MRKEETLTKDYAHINGESHFEISEALRESERQINPVILTKCMLDAICSGFLFFFYTSAVCVSAADVEHVFIFRSIHTNSLF